MREHERESAGNSERTDRETVAIEYQCLNCGKTYLQYYAINKEQQQEV